MASVIVYRRVSTEEQYIDGAGLRSQLEACEVWAAREGLPIRARYDEEEGTSGAMPLEKRTSLLAAIEDLKRGDVLLVAKRDRIARDPGVASVIENAVRRKKCRLISASGEGTGSDSPTDVLVRGFIDLVAQFERLRIRARTRERLAEKKKRGERTGRIPYGFDVIDDGRRSRTRGDGSGNLPIALVPNLGEQEVLAWMTRLRKEGWTHGRIAWALNHRGIVTKAGKPWHTSSVHHILSRIETALWPPPNPVREPAPPPAASPSPTSSAG